MAALLCCLVGCGSSTRASSHGAADDRPQALLVESVPAETSLGSADVADTHEVWLEMIDGAERRLDIAQFYVANKPGGGGRLEPVLRAVERAADRGVKVRLLADRAFASKYPTSLQRLGTRAAVRSTAAFGRGGGVHHAKYLIVDNREIFVGSANFDWRALEHIHELGIRLRSPALAGALRDIFEIDWHLAAGDDTRSGAATPQPQTATAQSWGITTLGDGAHARLLASPRGMLAGAASWDLPHLLAAIGEARERISVQLLTYDTSRRDGSRFEGLDAALRSAAQRGVAVRLLLSHWQRRHMESVQGLQSVPNIDVKLVTIPAHSSGFIPFARVAHAKYMVVDGRLAWLGSSNWKGEYFFASRNVGLLLQGGAVVRQLAEVFEQLYDSRHATMVDPTAHYEPPQIGP